MYDPLTVAFEIKRPWKDRRGFSPAIITVWHKDAERHGDDDSCGWSYVRLTKADRDWAEKVGHEEWAFWFGEEYGGLRDADSLQVLCAAWRDAKRYVKGGRRVTLTPADVAQCVALLSSPMDNLHFTVREARTDISGLADLLACVLRIYKTNRRKWWQHPKWHIHHWRLSFHLERRLSRWLFTRCAGCGGRFAYQESVYSGSMDRGPVSLWRRWTKGEPGLYHQKCYFTDCLQSADDNRFGRVPQT